MSPDGLVMGQGCTQEGSALSGQADRPLSPGEGQLPNFPPNLLPPSVPTPQLSQWHWTFTQVFRVEPGLSLMSLLPPPHES